MNRAEIILISLYIGFVILYFYHYYYIKNKFYDLQDKIYSLEYRNDITEEKVTELIKLSDLKKQLKVKTKPVKIKKDVKK